MTDKITTDELVTLFGPGMQVGETTMPAVPMEGLVLINQHQGTVDELREKLRALKNEIDNPRVLMWETPKKVKSKEEWADDYGFDGGPTGGYQSNMSDDDKARWKAKITGQKLGYPQVEIRKTAGSQMTVIVSLGRGYNYKHYRTDAKWGSTKDSGINVHVALNGPAQLTFKEMDEFHRAVQEAREVLQGLSV